MNLPGKVVWLLAVLCCGCGAARDDDRLEAYLIVDADAQQAGVEGFPGAVFRFDRASGTVQVFAADPRFRDPQIGVFDEHGDFLLVDFAADPEGRGRRTGCVFRIGGRSGQVVEFWAPEAFRAPNGLALGRDGTLYVTDRRARPNGASGQGVVFALDRATGACRTVATDPRFIAPAFVLCQEDGSLLVLDADTPSGEPGHEGVLFRVDVLTGEVAECGRLPAGVSPLGLLREPEGTLLVFDVNADPKAIGGPLGAIFRFDPDSGESELIASEPVFRDPVRGCFGADGLVLFVDANADPEGRGPDAAGRGQNVTGGGAILSLDRASAKVEVLAAPLEFVNPVAIVRAP